MIEGLADHSPYLWRLISADPARLALGIAYRGRAYLGWQSQPGGRTVQDALERALTAFAAVPSVLLAPVSNVALDRAARGLGKTFWFGPFKINFYGRSA